MFFNESKKLAAEHPLLRQEIEKIDDVLSVCGHTAILMASTLAVSLSLKHTRVASILELYEELGFLESRNQSRCQSCETLRPIPLDAYCSGCETEVSDGNTDIVIYVLGERAKTSVDSVKARRLATPVSVERTERGMTQEMHVTKEQLDRHRIEPWRHLKQDDDHYLLTCDRLAADELGRLKKKVERFGICLIRLSGFGTSDSLISEIAASLGDVMDEQNRSVGKVKRILPSKEVQPNSGDSALALGPHVDGTQHLTTPALLIFQYVVTAEAGARSQFWDVSRALLEMPELDRNELIEILSRPDAATFTKGEMSYTGPLIELASTESATCRLRFDEVISVHPAIQPTYDKLNAYFSQRGLEYMPKKGDIAIFDNRRLLHGRSEVLGDGQRIHNRMWIRELHPEFSDILLGIRPLTPEAMISLRRNKAKQSSGA